VTAYSSGVSQSAYGFTGEYATNDLVYLRARFYAVSMGRFLSRDTWNGDVNQPMSYNLWNYAYSNPVLHTDPTGLCTPSPSQNINYVETIVPKVGWLNTYAAAGIAIQCWGMAGDSRPGNDTWGPAQISYDQAQTIYGGRIADPSDPNNSRLQRGFGLRCYVPYGVIEEIGDCSICLTPDAMESRYGKDYPKYFHLEHWHDPENTTWAVTYMKRRIKLVIDKCDEKCTSTDIYIAAALAQNGPGFTLLNMKDLMPISKRINVNGLTLNWYDYFDRAKAVDTSLQLLRFDSAIQELRRRNWPVPLDVMWQTVRELSSKAPIR
jgi:RHS repeat-associated protein